MAIKFRCLIICFLAEEEVCSELQPLTAVYSQQNGDRIHKTWLDSELLYTLTLVICILYCLLLPFGIHITTLLLPLSCLLFFLVLGACCIHPPLLGLQIETSGADDNCASFVDRSGKIVSLPKNHWVQSPYIYKGTTACINSHANMNTPFANSDPVYNSFSIFISSCLLCNQLPFARYILQQDITYLKR